MSHDEQLEKYAISMLDKKLIESGVPSSPDQRALFYMDATRGILGRMLNLARITGDD